MDNTTYILGAGASYASMPLLATMAKRLKIFRDWVLHKKRDTDFQRHPLFNEGAIQELIDDIDRLISNIMNSTSIDNYANALFNANTRESLQKLMNLKFILSIYFIFEQLDKEKERFRTTEIDATISVVPHAYKNYSQQDVDAIKKQYDPRYRTFFNEFFDQRVRKFPAHLNILSWNYDLQIEGSYCRDFSCSLDQAQAELNIYPSDGFAVNDNISKIIKLNGTAGVFTNSTGVFENYLDVHMDVDDFLLAASSGFQASKTTPIATEGIKFAFEDRAMTGRAIAEARKILLNTDILVVIGYSFPSMNRNIDTFLLKDISRIKAVYLQVPAGDQIRIRRNFKNANKYLEGKVEWEDNLNEFFIPPAIY